jgi:hypothetical protein
MALQASLRAFGRSGRYVQLFLDDHGFLWSNEEQVNGIEREDGEVVLTVGERHERVRVEADAYLDFVGLRPVRTE